MAENRVECPAGADHKRSVFRGAGVANEQTASALVRTADKLGIRRATPGLNKPIVAALGRGFYHWST